jgi:hypothetical protein
MLYFLRKAVIFLTLSLVVYCGLGFIAEKIIQTHVEHDQYDLQADWHIQHKEYNELLFVGNSRTWVQIDAAMLSEATHKKSYCLAQDGREAKVLFWKLKAYLQRNRKPARIFIQFDPYFINSRNEGTFYGKRNYLGYLFGDRLKINKLFQSELGFSKYDELLPLVRYFSTEGGLPLLFRHLTAKKSAASSGFRYGSELQKREWNQAQSYSHPDKTRMTLHCEYIDSLLTLCAQLHIKTILMYPPQSFSSYQQVDRSIKHQLQEYAAVHKLTYWDFNSGQYDDSLLFYNHMHLNHIGARKYTTQLIDSILHSRSLQ